MSAIAVTEFIIQEGLDYNDQISVEAAFSALAECAAKLETTLKTALIETKKLSSAAITGNLVAIRKARRSVDELNNELRLLQLELDRFDESPILRTIRSRSFLYEIVDIAKKLGNGSFRVVGTMILAFPNRLTVDEKGIRISRKPSQNVRPSYLATTLINSASSATSGTLGFIEILFAAYRVKCPDGDKLVSLTEIYDLLTLLPEARKSYSETTFVADLSILDAFGPYQTKDDFKISFVAATGTRMGGGYHGVSPTGEEVTYGNIRFEKVS